MINQQVGLESFLIYTFVFGSVSWTIYLFISNYNERQRRALARKQEQILQRTEVRAEACGHKTRLRDKVTVFGKSFWLTLPLTKAGGVTFCHKCLVATAKQCCRCHEPIFYGAPISLHSYCDGTGEVAKVHFENQPVLYLGCVRGDCVDDQQQEHVGHLLVEGIHLLSGEEIFFNVLSKVKFVAN